ncbi:hypothetical protein [Cellulomonas citrea]|uniref:hypothetical protein n=1 Tax=Cellulomonas citrea TaxID=1909423 RepID=UPI00135B52CE|nr:hypothetical protein [Cellulomonas citrea]
MSASDARPEGEFGMSGVPRAPELASAPSPWVVDGRVRMPHRPWSTILVLVHATCMAIGLVAIVGGAVIAARDYSTPPDQRGPDAWGVALGALLIGVGLAMTVADGILTVTTVRGRRVADQGWPGPLRTAAGATLVLALIGACVSLVGGGLSPLTPAGFGVCGLYALPAIVVLSSTARPPTAAPHWPAGGPG